MSKTKANPYAMVTERMMALLQDGKVPWRKTWQGVGDANAPRSISTGKPYRGINAILLGGCANPNWGTYNAIKKAGGQVRKGEQGSTAIFWKFFLKEDEKTGEKKSIPFLRHFNVFNVDQAEWPEGLPEKLSPPKPPTGDDVPVKANETAQAIVKGYLGSGGPGFTEGGDMAFYRPSTDSVTVPALESYDDEGEYWSTVFHELGHSTGHASRLNRKGIQGSIHFGSEIYSKEELVAEFTACFLCSDSGIVDTRENSAAYLRGWLSKLEEDPKLVVHAAAAATKAAVLINPPVEEEGENS